MLDQLSLREQHRRSLADRCIDPGRPRLRIIPLCLQGVTQHRPRVIENCPVCLLVLLAKQAEVPGYRRCDMDPVLVSQHVDVPVQSRTAAAIGLVDNLSRLLPGIITYLRTALVAAVDDHAEQVLECLPVIL